MKRSNVHLLFLSSALWFICLIAPSISAQQLPTWTGTYGNGGMPSYSYTVVGNNPNTNPQTTIPTLLIPLKLVFESCTGEPCTFDAQDIMSNVTASPVFSSATNFTQGGVDLGTTQYIDAYMRGNFWGVMKTWDYHLLLGGPTLFGDLTITVPTDQGCAGSFDFGFQAGEVGWQWLKGKLETYMSTEAIQPNTLPVFLSYDATITGPGPNCNGNVPALIGVHDFNGGQTFVQASYFDQVSPPGTRETIVTPDVSTLTHEVAEWAMDPFVSNYPTACNTALEVADPLENGGQHLYAYLLPTFTYHLQDLAFLPYFGASTSTSVNGWFSFQGENDNGSNGNIPCGTFNPMN